MQPVVDVPIFGLDDAIAALRSASVRGTVVRLTFPFAAASSLGPDVLCEIIRQARLRLPEAAFDWLVECGDEPGTVLAMLRAGVPRLRFDGPEPLRRSLNEIAHQYSAAIEAPSPSPEGSSTTCGQVVPASDAATNLHATPGRNADGGSVTADGHSPTNKDEGSNTPRQPALSTRCGPYISTQGFIR